MRWGTHAAGLLLAATLSAGSAWAGGFTPELFDAWIKMRAGDGQPVYWYATGNVLQEGTGKLLSRMEGFDTARVMRDPAKPNSWIQLSRKIFISVDPATGEIMKDRDGNLRKPIAYPYQVKTYTLDGDEIAYTVQSHDSSVVADEPTQKNYTVTRIGKVMHVNYAMFIDRVRGDGSRVQRFEVNDFFYRPDAKSEAERFQYTWVGTGPGPIVASAVSWRFAHFDAMPRRIVDYVKANAPLWMEPPKDMAEIARLRQTIPYQLGQK
jgi:hypothetical protein